MASDPSLMALPALRKLAEEQARKRFDLVRSELRTVREEPVLPLEWEFPANTTRAAWTTAELSLLSDLTRPESRDAVARLVAERIGWDAFDVTRAVESSTAMLAGLYRAAGLPELPRWEPAQTPAEALTLIALAVLGGAS